MQCVINLQAFPQNLQGKWRIQIACHCSPALGIHKHPQCQLRFAFHSFDPAVSWIQGLLQNSKTVDQLPLCICGAAVKERRDVSLKLPSFLLWVPVFPEISRQLILQQFSLACLCCTAFELDCQIYSAFGVTLGKPQLNNWHLIFWAIRSSIIWDRPHYFIEGGELSFIGNVMQILDCKILFRNYIKKCLFILVNENVGRRELSSTVMWEFVL